MLATRAAIPPEMIALPSIDCVRLLQTKKKKTFQRIECSLTEQVLDNEEGRQRRQDHGASKED